MAARTVIDCRHERRLISVAELLTVTPHIESLYSFTTVGIQFQAVNELRFSWPQAGQASASCPVRLD
jgi:hypothetical protein